MSQGKLFCTHADKAGPQKSTSAAALRRRMNRASLQMEGLENRVLLSAVWFVATNGNDANPGTVTAPFRTIQHAASIANTGDAVMIRGGTYRETVHPTNSSVTFESYGAENVVISGADPVGGWTSAGGSVYQKSLTWSLGEGNNQVFVDGQAMNEARWPNTSLDPSHPTQATIQSYSNGTIYNTSLSQPAGYWTGALVHISPGNGWVSYSATVSNSGPGWIQIAGLPVLSTWETPARGTPFYLYGKFQALDTAGEYYIDSSNRLFLWDPRSDDPAYHDVEVKHRLWAFDLSGISNTTIQGINIFAASIHTDIHSSYTVLNHITASYIDQLGWIANGWSAPTPWGIELQGAHSTLENSTIAYSAGDGVLVGGSACTIYNNVIHDVDYGGIDAAGIRIYGWYASVSKNTIYNAGRDGINLEAPHAIVANNVIHDVMLQTTDGGGIYSVSLNGQGTQIYGNTVYNATSGGWGSVGIFLDNDCSNFIVHDNTIWNCNAALKLNFTSLNEQVYNNKLGGNQLSISNNGTYSWAGSQFYNNTYYNTVKLGTGVTQWGNVFSSGSPIPPNYQTTPPPASTSADSIIQALSYSSQSNVAPSGNAVGYTVNGSWVEYNNIDFGTGAYTKFVAALAVPQAYAGQKIVLHLDSLGGTILGTLTTTSTGSWSTFAAQLTAISKVSGVHNLYLQFVGTGGICNLLSFTFA